MKQLFTNRLATCRLFVALMAGIIAAGCATPDPQLPRVEELDKIKPKALLQREARIKPPEPAAFDEKMEPVTIDLEENTQLYTLLFEKAPLGDILNSIVADTDFNLSIESGIDLTRPVTVRTKNVTLREALDMVVVRSSGYAWKIDESFLHIQRFDERIYHLDYLDISGETDIDIGGDMLSASVEDSGVTGKFQIKAKRTAKRNDVWNEIEAALKALKSAEGLLHLNRNAGIIYMADSPIHVKTMIDFLDAVSKSLNRQVFIDAKIMEVKLNDENKYGIDWTEIEILFTRDFGVLPDNFELFLNSGGKIALADASSIVSLVDFLRTQGEVSVLSNPHLAVLNSQSAMLTVGFQFPYGDISGVDENFETNTITFRSSIKRSILGLQLGLTPQISKDGIISLLIVPTITRIKEEIPVTLPTSTGTQAILNPVIDLQELATTVRVREGQSILLAGLINQVKSNLKEGLPFLNQIPGLKHFFGRVNESSENSELVIFLTPYVKTVN
jgi:MSHA biogenesis protein MshL